MQSEIQTNPKIERTLKPEIELVETFPEKV